MDQYVNVQPFQGCEIFLELVFTTNVKHLRCFLKRLCLIYLTTSSSDFIFEPCFERQGRIPKGFNVCSRVETQRTTTPKELNIGVRVIVILVMFNPFMGVNFFGNWIY